jgi:hypothetical protein
MIYQINIRLKRENAKLSSMGIEDQNAEKVQTILNFRGSAFSSYWVTPDEDMLIHFYIGDYHYTTEYDQGKIKLFNQLLDE